MPAPLGKTPTRKMPKITVYGVDDSQATRAAIRFFRERRIVVEYLDLRKKPLPPAEVRRFIERLGPDAFLDASAGGFDAARPAGDLVAAVRADPRLLRLPFVVYRDALTAGPCEPTWRDWLARGGPADARKRPSRGDGRDEPRTIAGSGETAKD